LVTTLIASAANISAVGLTGSEKGILNNQRLPVPVMLYEVRPETG
jgi:hypothetical protein